MKLKFKTQTYQTAAVQAVVDCFKGQPPASREAISYRIDPGKQAKGQTIGSTVASDAGFRNADLFLSGTFFHEKSGKLVYERSSASSSMQEHVYLDGSIVASRGLSFNIPGGSASVSYRHTDLLGSAVTTTDAGQSVVFESKYEPYGAISNRAPMNEVGFTGHSHDAASGLVYMQQRYYDPVIGRFLSADPVTVLEGGGFNRYSYGNNNPYKFVDPDGRQSSAQVVDAFMRHY